MVNKAIVDLSQHFEVLAKEYGVERVSYSETHTGLANFTVSIKDNKYLVLNPKDSAFSVSDGFLGTVTVTAQGLDDDDAQVGSDVVETFSVDVIPARIDKNSQGNEELLIRAAPPPPEDERTPVVIQEAVMGGNLAGVNSFSLPADYEEFTYFTIGIRIITTGEDTTNEIIVKTLPTVLMKVQTEGTTNFTISGTSIIWTESLRLIVSTNRIIFAELHD